MDQFRSKKSTVPQIGSEMENGLKIVNSAVMWAGTRHEGTPMVYVPARETESLQVPRGRQ